MAKVVTNKLRTLYIMDALLEKSDAEHRLSTNDLLTTLRASRILSGEQRFSTSGIKTSCRCCTIFKVHHRENVS